MCGGNNELSAAELAQLEIKDQERAKAESDRINAEKEKEKQSEKDRMGWTGCSGQF